MSSPGFTAEQALSVRGRKYRSESVDGEDSISGEVRGAAHIGARSLGDPTGPFSGSCGCWPGVCCCIFCYFTSCYWWCWSSYRTATV
jgi:hypothetical protein